MIGIYIIKNSINDKVYVGQSVNIEKRWQAHRHKGKPNVNLNQPEANNKLHKAMRELGRENFYIEVLEECSVEKLEEKEKYWIEYYNSFYNGYNGTKGGSFYDSTSSVGENNGKSKLMEEDVYYIRECYNNLIPFRVVYELYKDKIGKKGLQNIWHFQTWAYIHPEYYNEKNRYWHSHNAKANESSVAKNNKRVFSKDEILKMREKYRNGETVTEIWRKLYPKMSKSTIRNAILGITYKDID